VSEKKDFAKTERRQVWRRVGECNGLELDQSFLLIICGAGVFSYQELFLIKDFPNFRNLKSCTVSKITEKYLLCLCMPSLLFLSCTLQTEARSRNTLFQRALFEVKHALPKSTNWLSQFGQYGYVRLGQVELV
jgi:hypothetical protein